MEEVKALSKPTITIITPSFNRAGMITNAIESVLAQDFQAFEHIIIDGGSTDGTLNILKQYPHLKVISELDQGMYDALNKGLELATGEIIGFLNTDDLYAENIFSPIARKFDDPAIMAVTGHAIVFTELPSGSFKVVNKYSPEERSLFENLTRAGAFFNAWFFRKAAFGQIGTFNSNYKIAGDRDFMFRFALNNLRYVTIDTLVYKYRMHQDSLTFDKNSEKRVWSATEHLTMIRYFLAKRKLPSSVRKLLIYAQTSETVDMAARSLWMHNYKKFVYYSFEGVKYNFFWPLKFFQYILTRGMAFLLAKQNTKGPH
jgi:glycosyltransferase involved in cell wall biosynthesis